MDREIPKSQLRRARIKRLAIYGGIAAAVIVAGIVTSKLTRTSVSLDKLTLVSVDRGDVNTSVTGYGSVEPAFEEIINSPLTTRVIEVYHRPGDIVDAGTPLLLLDLETARNEYNKQLDQLAMMRLQLEQLRAANATRLGDLRMQIKVADMKLNRLRVELANERYLDSIGSGTTDRVREVEFAYKSGLLEYQQLEQQLANETRRADADIELKRLEIEIKDKELSEASRTLDIAEIRAPRRATVSTVVDRIGAQVTQGQQVAVIADLGHYKVEGEMADSHAAQLRAGNRAKVKVGREYVEGRVASVTPTSKNGTLSFSVALDCDSAAMLRPGLKADIHVSSGLKENVVRIPNIRFYTGPRDYDLYVFDGGDELKLRHVNLGFAGPDYIEVISGLAPGDRVVVDDMSRFGNTPSIKVK